MSVVKDVVSRGGSDYLSEGFSTFNGRGEDRRDVLEDGLEFTEIAFCGREQNVIGIEVFDIIIRGSGKIERGKV
jgi:hypothetical protein